MPPTLSPAVKSQFEGVIINFNDPDQTNLLTTLKQQNPTEASQIEAAHAAYKSCFTTTPDKARCLAQIASGTQPTPPGSGAAAKNITHSATPNELAARSIAQDFFDNLKNKGVTLTGNPEKDRETIDKEWQIYETANKDKAAISGAREAVYRWFSLGSWFSLAGFLTKSKNFSKDLTGVLGTSTGFVVAAIAFGLDVLTLFNIQIKSDNPLLMRLAAPLLDLEGINSDVGGTMDMTDTTFGMMGQIMYNPLLDSFLRTLPNDKRPIAQNILASMTLIGLFKANLLQMDLIDVAWAERYQPDIRSMVEQLMRYLFAHGDMGKVGQAHRFMPEVNPQSAFATDVFSYTIRGGMALLIGWNAYNNAKLYVRGSTDKAIIDRAKTPENTSQSSTFQDTARALAANDQRKSFAMMMTDALVMSDILMQTGHEIFKDDQTVRYLTPAAAFALTTLVFGLCFSLNVGDTPSGDEGLQELIDKYKLNTTADTLTSKTEGIVSNSPAVDTFVAFLFGGMEALAAGYAKNRRAVVESFAMVNNMIGTNHLLTQTANASSLNFEASGQGEGDPKAAITAAMKTVAALDIVNSAWAGLDAGSTAYLAEGPAYLEIAPAAAGFAIRLAYLIQAFQVEGAGSEEVKTQEYINAGVYVGGVGLGVLLSWILHDKFDFSFKFENGQYAVDGQVGPAPGGLVVRGSFGPAAPTPKTRQEELLAEMNRDQKILEELKNELGTINAQITANPDLLPPEQKNALATRGRAIVKSMLTLNTSMAKNGAELTREQIADIDQGLRTGLIAFNPADPMQRKLVTGELLPGLIAKRKFLANQIATLGSKAPLPLFPGQRHISMFRNPVLPSYTPEEQALADSYSQAFNMVEAQIKRLESGSSADLIALYQENTGVNLVLQGFNPVLQNYKQRLEIQHRQLAMTVKLYEMMLPG